MISPARCAACGLPLIQGIFAPALVHAARGVDEVLIALRCKDFAKAVAEYERTQAN